MSSALQSRDSRRDRRSSRKLKRKKKIGKSKAFDELYDITAFSDDEDEDEEQQKILDILGNLLTNDTLSDVHFIVGLKEKMRIPAHRVLLAARSEVFERMLNGPMKEANSNMDIEVPDMEPSAFIAMLRFVYTGKSDLTPESAMGTLYAAKKYGVHGLRLACVKYLKKSLTLRNACMMLAQAQLFDEEILEKQCMKIIERNSKEVLCSAGFRELPVNCLRTILLNDNLPVIEILIFRVCIKWAESECKRQRLDTTAENKKKVMEDIIPLIRFPLMSSTEIVEEVVESEILTSEELVQLFCYSCSKPGYQPRIDFPSKPRIKFLVIGTDWAHEVKQLIASLCPVIVDALNPNVDQPTLAQCEQYHAILAFSSSSFTFSDELGDILADYVDGGGGVVIAAIATDSDSHGLGGRFARDEYIAMKRGERSHDSRHILGKKIIPDHPILRGVATFDGGPQSWRVKTSLNNNSKLIAEWEDGIPLVSEKAIRDRYCSVALNMWPPSRSISKDGWETFTDGDKFLINSLMHVSNTWWTT